jgi:hypothetical protein
MSELRFRLINTDPQPVNFPVHIEYFAGLMMSGRNTGPATDVFTSGGGVNNS